MNFISLKNLSRDLKILGSIALVIFLLILTQELFLSIPFLSGAIVYFSLAIGVAKKERWAGLFGLGIFGFSLFSFLVLAVTNMEAFMYSILGFLIILIVFFSFINFMKQEEIKKEVSLLPLIFVIIGSLMGITAFFYSLSDRDILEQRESFESPASYFCENHACRGLVAPEDGSVHYGYEGEIFDNREDCINYCVESILKEDDEDLESGKEEATGLKTYRNERYGFEIDYPYESSDIIISDEILEVLLPVEQDSRVFKKTLTISRTEGDFEEPLEYYCKQGIPHTYIVDFNGLNFCKIRPSEEIEDGAVSNGFAYHLIIDNKWISFDIQHLYCIPESFDDPCSDLVEFDWDKGIDNLNDIMSTFRFLD